MTLINAKAQYKLVHGKLEVMPLLIIANNRAKNIYFLFKFIVKQELTK